MVCLIVIKVLAGAVAVANAPKTSENGNDKPNLLGRDTFGFYVTPKGHVADSSILSDTDISIETKVNNCKNNTTGGFGKSSAHCFGALIDNGWKMDY